MVKGFKDLTREDKVDKELHTRLWNKYLDHIIKSGDVISSVSDITSIHQFVLNLVEYRHQELKTGLILFVKFYLNYFKNEDPDIEEYLMDKARRDRFDYLITEIYLNDLTKFKPVKAELKEVNQFLNTLIYRRESNVFFEDDELESYSLIQSYPALSELIERVNLLVQEKKHSNVIVQLLSLYFRDELNKDSIWANLPEETKSKVEGGSVEKLPAGRPKNEKFTIEKVKEHFNEFLKEKPYPSSRKYWHVGGVQDGAVKLAQVAEYILYNKFKAEEGQFGIKSIKNRMKEVVPEKYLPEHRKKMNRKKKK